MTVVKMRHMLLLLPLAVCSCATRAYVWNVTGEHVEASRGTSDHGTVIVRGERNCVNDTFMGDHGDLVLCSYDRRVPRPWRYVLPDPKDIPAAYLTGDAVRWCQSYCLALEPAGRLYLLRPAGGGWDTGGYRDDQPAGFPLTPKPGTGAPQN